MPEHATPTDPDLVTWLTPLRIQQVQEWFAAPAVLLAESGALRAVLKAWVEAELAAEVDWTAPPDLLEGTSRWAEQAANSDDAIAQGLTQERLIARKLRKPALMAWARSHWQHRLETLFLARKAELDRAACRLLRVDTHALAQELYHRIKTDGESFAEIAKRFGREPGDGLISLRPLSQLPKGLAPLLQRLQPGELSVPLAIGSRFGLVQLDDWQPVSFDEETKGLLLQQELNSWTEALVSILVTHLLPTTTQSIDAAA